MKNDSKAEKLKKYILYSIGCGLICVLLTLVLHFSLDKLMTNMVERIENVWFDYLCDFRQRYFSSNKSTLASQNIIYVWYNDASDSILNKRWPYDRADTAKVIEYLRLAGAKAILFDIIFASENNKDHNTIESDNFLVDATRKADNVYMGAKFAGIDQYNKNTGSNYKENFVVDLQIEGNKNLNDYSFIKNNLFLKPPFEKLLMASKGIGFFNSTRDHDNIKRTNDLIFCTDNKCYPSLAFACFLDLLGTRKVKLYPGKYFEVKGIRIPVTPENQVYINWLGGISENVEITREIENLKKLNLEEKDVQEKLKKLNVEKEFYTLFLHEKISVWKLIKDYDLIQDYLKTTGATEEDITGKLNLVPGLNSTPVDFKNKLVIVGVTSASAEDFIGSPFGFLPGVINHGFLLDSLINENFIKPLNPQVSFVLLLIVCILTFSTVFFASSKDSPLYVILPIVYILIFCLFSIYIFGKSSVFVPFFDNILGIIIATLGSISLYFVVEGKSKKQVKNAMSNYLSPQVMKAVLDNPDQLKPSASRRKELTILFSDIRGFTTFSESNPAELVVRMLNEYLFAMTNIIFKHSGTLDKFIGDAIMAFWGAPIDVEDQPMCAVRTALEMKEKVEELNTIWKKVYKHQVQIGIGINTEEVVVGNIGSEKFMDYTVIGDGVNLAARLESLNKNYKTTIIISENTYRLVKDEVVVKYLDTVKVKGKTEETEIYELIGLIESDLDSMKGDLE